MYKLNLKPQTVNHLFWDLIDRKAVDPEILAELMNFNIKGDQNGEKIFENNF